MALLVKGTRVLRRLAIAYNGAQTLTVNCARRETASSKPGACLEAFRVTKVRALSQRSIIIPSCGISLLLNSSSKVCEVVWIHVMRQVASELGQVEWLRKQLQVGYGPKLRSK